ncbi:hypothetical protein [Catenulispora rubra]|uniref:hypothetical protein n=1 Tax=Catenulispora rubra TaxID=280293 RepID=UPI0018928319|nr:hypothetical protein [Catenulispora rubra]
MADPTVPNPVDPPEPSGPSGPSSKPGLSSRSLAVGGVIGVVVGALGVGIPWAMSGSGKAFGAESGSLKAPASIGVYVPTVQNPKTDPATAKRIQASDPISAENLSAAYGGAATVVQQYSDAGLENFVVLEAVRAQSPTPFLPYVDAASIGMAKPNQEVDTFGHVSCLVAYIPVPAGQQEQPGDSSAITCERTSAHLTVRLRFGGGGDLMHSPQQAAALVDTAWSLMG